LECNYVLSFFWPLFVISQNPRQNPAEINFGGAINSAAITVHTTAKAALLRETIKFVVVPIINPIVKLGSEVMISRIREILKHARIPITTPLTAACVTKLNFILYLKTIAERTNITTDTTSKADFG
jgi:fructose-bisphosphate aldolase class 1